MRVTVYCSGSIQKGPSDRGKLCWTRVEQNAVAQAARPVEILFLNPDDPVANLDDTLSAFGRDMCQVEIADFVIVDARERRGIGIGVELVAAKLFGTPLIVVVPPGSYYRQTDLAYRGATIKNYIHPHVDTLADAIVDDFHAAGKWIKEFRETGFQPKGVEAIHEAVAAYRSRMLPHDEPMQKILQALTDEPRYVRKPRTQ